MDIFDTVVERIKPKVAGCLGIYMSLEAIYAAELSFAEPTPKIIRYVRIPLNTSGVKSSAMNVDFITDPKNWVEAFRNASDKMKWGTTHAVVTLSPQFSVFRHFLMPRIDRRYWRQSVPIEAKKYLPFTFEDTSYDFSTYDFDSGDGKPKMGVLFALTNKRITAAVLDGFKKAGITVTAVEVSSVSMGRFLTNIGEKKTAGRAFAHFHGNNAYVALTYGEVPLFYREMSFTEAQMLERRRIDLASALDYTDKQMDAKLFTEIMVSGDGLSAWRPVVEDEAKLPVKIWAPKDLLKIKDLEWPTSVAAGAAMRLMPPGFEAADLCGLAGNSNLSLKALVISWTGAALLLLLMFGLIILTTVHLHSANSQFYATKNKVQSLSEFEGMSASDIEGKVSALRDKAQMLTAMLGNNEFVTPKLVAIADTAVDNMWITNMTYMAPIRKSVVDRADNSVVINGIARTGDNARDVAVINSFRDAFKKNADIDKFCGPQAGRMDLNYSAVANTAGGNAIGGVNDTQFSLKCYNNRN